MKILVLNSGSSSLKFKLFVLPELQVTAAGMVEQIGADLSHARLVCLEESSERSYECAEPIAEHRQAIALVMEMLRQSGALADIDQLAAIGHRVVHGGESFHEPVLIDDRVIAAIENLVPLAPLHNPANLTGIRVAMEHAAEVPQVAVFDTAFHQSIPQEAFLYALPYSLYQKHDIRRYGFHGTSHAYVAKQAARYLNIPSSDLNIITLHLGNGASAAAVKGGKCIDTSMGFTPLEGLIMGTRSGDLDPAILFYLSRKTGMDLGDLDILLNKESGLKGVCGDNDMRTISEESEAGDKQAALALKMFCYRLKKYIGAYWAALGGLDCLVFTGGIGEHSSIVRRLTCENLERLGITLDHQKNQEQQQSVVEIQNSESRVKILVVPTDEELEIATQTLDLICRAI